MDEQELWTPADDETIRHALDSLSWESDALPLADVRFVKARGSSRRRRALVVGAAAAAAAVAIVGVLGFNALGRNEALDLSPAAPSTTATHSPVPLPAVTDPDICGPWSSLASQPMQDLVAVHGDIKQCTKIASGWLFVTQHSSGPGEVGTMDCHSSPACMDGRQDRDLSRYVWQKAPPRGTSLSVLGQDGAVLTLFDGPGQITFNTDTKKFGPGSNDVAAARCQNGQLAVTVLGNGAAAGSVGQVIGFINVSKVACTLTGYPGVAGLDAQGRQVTQAQRQLMGMVGGLANGATTPPAVTLAPRQSASAMVEGSDNPVGTATSCTYYPSLLVTPPNLTQSTKVTIALSGSTIAGFPGCSSLGVDPVVPGRTGRLN